MSPATDDIRGIDLSEDEYTVEQSLVRNKYVAEDADGEVVLRGKQKLLDNDLSFLQDTWRVRDPDTERKLAEINSRGALVTLARNSLPFGEWIPHEYEITDRNGDHVGSIERQFALRDRYEITIDDASDVPKEPVVAAAMVIDAIQKN